MNIAIRLSALGVLLLSGSAFAVDPSRFRDIDLGIDPIIIEPIFDTGGTGGESGDCLEVCIDTRQSCQSQADSLYDACRRAAEAFDYQGTNYAGLADDLAYCAEVANSDASTCLAEYGECTMACQN